MMVVVKAALIASITVLMGWGALERSQTQKDTTKGKSTSIRYAVLRRSAGVVYCVTNCNITVAMMELYGSESKTQVYHFLWQIITFCLERGIPFPSTNAYDDGCHFIKFILNR